MDNGLEVWAGIECSYTRVGDRYADQLARTGLYDRPEELDRVIALGVRAVRFPVLWERWCALGSRAWEWTDRALERLQGAGVTPIIGLMHHGSGPLHASLVDDAFPELLTQFAREVAERYPWVRHYTPINEPLTTARFATLYGHWYPHHTSPRTFGRAMVQQCRAIGQAMRAIREVTPTAQLVQTEDLGKAYATSVLQYQADFENERRWLTFDLLWGHVVDAHPLAVYLRWAGVDERVLLELADQPCPPDVVGINHYVTSERFLDHRLLRYPRALWGGNERHRYADVEAVRVLGKGLAGPYALLREAWDRYRQPIAVTEVQLACTREHQLRWLHEVWHAALWLRTEGVDIRAVTAWSVFGAHDWSSLLTRNDGHYEPGAFDVRAPEPRDTALAQMIRSLAHCGWFDHAVLGSPGWWHCDERLTYPRAATTVARATPQARAATASLVKSRRRVQRPILIVGAGGTLGRGVTRGCQERGLDHVALSRSELDVANDVAIARTLAGRRPWLVVNCAGFVRVDDAECERGACWSANTEGARALARGCAAINAKLVTFSTDLVFDGVKATPYVESDGVCPLNEYGRTKAEAEAAVLSTTSDALVVRTAAFFGDHDEHNFVTLALRALAARTPFGAVSDVVVSPTYVPDLVNAVLDLAIDNERGLWHLTSVGAVSWEELAKRAARVARLAATTLYSVTLAELGLQAVRPKFSVLSSERATIMASLDDALARYARSRAWERAPARRAASTDLPARRSRTTTFT